MRQILSL